MPPTTSRDFQKAAGQRLTTAEALIREGLTLDAQYIEGYTIEYSLKALILHLTPDSDKPEKLKRITCGAKMHRADVLPGELRDPGVALPLDLARRMRRFDWTTDLRYETGRRDTGETTAFLRTAKPIYDWVEGQLPRRLHQHLDGKRNGRTRADSLKRPFETQDLHRSMPIATTRHRFASG